MKFVALVSGGKDSCFNILHCLNAGHELVAIANLRPRPCRPDEIDSYMFQTVGHQAVELLAQCVGVPLYRVDISEDEEAVINELVGLFTKIKNEIEFESVSVGAIASTYQQIRVDRACQLTGLRSLAYLWQRDQSELLHEIVQSGIDARIIKVAGMGLNERHLGQSLRDLETELLDLHTSIGLHPCGEGGEYETMVFNAPFFQQCMRPVNEKAVQHSTDDVYFLDFGVELTSKNNGGRYVRVPPLLSPEFDSILNSVRNKGESTLTQLPKPVIPGQSLKYMPSNHTIFTARGKLEKVFDTVGQHFSSVGIARCFHVVVTIRDMRKFAEMNAQYISVFTNAPDRSRDYIDPSRACIESNTLPWDIELTLFETKKPDLVGKGIHVQGLSYWAPASIGPYSQCRMWYGISYVAGQIPLEPQSLALVTGREEQAVLALQHATRVLDAIHERRDNYMLRLGIVYLTETNDHDLAQTVWSHVSSLPLIAVVVSALPRGAKFEWSVQACDKRYFEWFVPESDEEDDMYSPHPELLECRATGYIHRAGFQALRVSTSAIERPQLVFTQNEQAVTPGHLLPSRQLFFNGTLTSELYIHF